MIAPEFEGIVTPTKTNEGAPPGNAAAKVTVPLETPDPNGNSPEIFES
jgi:hypothetical protein